MIRKPVNLSDQSRLALIPTPGAGGILGPGGTEDTGPVPVGRLAIGGAGYDGLSGMIVSDQPFTLDVYEGADPASLPHVQLFTASLDAVTGLYHFQLRWLVFGEWVRLVVTNTGGVPTAIYNRSLYALPVANQIPGLYPNHPIYVIVSDTGEATDGTSFSIPTVAGVEGQLVPAAGNRINFWVKNTGGAPAYLRHVTPSQAAPAVVTDMEIAPGQFINVEKGGSFEWRYIDGGVATVLRVSTFLR